MGALNTSFVTLPELMKLVDAQGNFLRSTNMMVQANEILQVMTWIPTNQVDTHLLLQAISLPKVYTAMVNKGTLPSDGKDVNLYEPTGKFESVQEIAANAAELLGDPAKLMSDKSAKHREAHARNFVSSMFYGNSLTNPDLFPGLCQRFNDPTDNNGANIIPGGPVGGSHMTSLWLMAFGEGALNGIYPKNTMAGLRTEDLGKETKQDPDNLNAILRVYRAIFGWSAGIALDDWKWVVRCPNIDTDKCDADAADKVDLLNVMRKMFYRLPSTAVKFNSEAQGRRMGWFMNRFMRMELDKQAQKNIQIGGQLKVELVDGVMRDTWRGIPIYTVDQITKAEAGVTF